jgi:hypothetical protein
MAAWWLRTKLRFANSTRPSYCPNLPNSLYGYFCSLDRSICSVGPQLSDGRKPSGMVARMNLPVHWYASISDLILSE